LNLKIDEGNNMKFTKKCLIASAMVILSAQAFADDFSYSDQTVFTAETATKDAAYKLGMSTLNTLQADTSNQLEKKFWWVSMPINNMTLEGNPYITVLEKMDDAGKVTYKGIVHVSLRYETDDNEQDNEY